MLFRSIEASKHLLSLQNVKSAKQSKLSKLEISKNKLKNHQQLLDKIDYSQEVIKKSNLSVTSAKKDLRKIVPPESSPLLNKKALTLLSVLSISALLAFYATARFRRRKGVFTPVIAEPEPDQYDAEIRSLRTSQKRASSDDYHREFENFLKNVRANRTESESKTSKAKSKEKRSINIKKF